MRSWAKPYCGVETPKGDFYHRNHTPRAPRKPQPWK